MNDGRLRFTPLSAFFIVVFAAIHFVFGYILVFAWMRFWSWLPAAIVGRVLVNIWWFPGQQLLQLHHADNPASGLAFAIATSFLWGVVVFVLWKARQGQYLRFSLRTLLAVATLIAVLLGTIAWLEK